MTRTLFVPTATVLTVALVNKDIQEMAHFAKVEREGPLSPLEMYHLHFLWGSHLSLMTGHRKRTHLLTLIIGTSLERLFQKKLQSSFTIMAEVLACSMANFYCQ